MRDDTCDRCEEAFIPGHMCWDCLCIVHGVNPKNRRSASIPPEATEENTDLDAAIRTSNLFRSRIIRALAVLNNSGLAPKTSAAIAEAILLGRKSEQD